MGRLTKAAKAAKEAKTSKKVKTQGKKTNKTNRVKKDDKPSSEVEESKELEESKDLEEVQEVEEPTLHKYSFFKVVKNALLARHAFKKNQYLAILKGTKEEKDVLFRCTGDLILYKKVKWAEVTNPTWIE